MKDSSLVSVVIPTYNSEKTLAKCLESIKNQTYKNTEGIIVDNFSTDKTTEIAREHGANVIEIEAIRSKARNIGIQQSKGYFVLCIDSDMELTQKVVEDCAKIFQLDKNAGGVIIPEKSIGDNFWVKVRDFERSFYEDTEIESARFFRKDLAEKVGGYEEDVVFYEESTLPQKIEKLGHDVKLRVNSYILHNEPDFNLMSWLRKKYYYAKTLEFYSSKYKDYASRQVSISYRYSLFFKNENWKRFMSKPLLALSTLLLKSLEFMMLEIGYLNRKIWGKNAR
jgi:glycosyltransferase involved in cell wall biosynthesis